MPKPPTPVLDTASLRFQPATPARWADVEALFGDRGACAGCWCMFWRLRRKDWEAGKGAGNKRRFRALIEGGAKPGILAYTGREPIGWCALAPREEYDYLTRSRTLKPLDEQSVWSVSCFFVLRPYRRQGVATRLLEAAVAHAAKRGARVVEGYPTEAGSDAAPDAFLWQGTPDVFRNAGFHEAARPSRTRYIMRRATEAAAP